MKEREANGYTYEAADASFELLARRMLGNVPQFFDVKSFRVMVERRHNADGDLVTVSEATVKVRIDGETMLSVGEGNGPVNALDTALRKDLGRYQSYISDLELVDYKVRILTGGTDAVTRVLIESRDGEGNRWFTVGVSPNIVDASFEALLELDQLQADPRRRERRPERWCSVIHSEPLRWHCSRHAIRSQQFDGRDARQALEVHLSSCTDASATAATLRPCRDIPVAVSIAGE